MLEILFSRNSILKIKSFPRRRPQDPPYGETSFSGPYLELPSLRPCIHPGVLLVMLLTQFRVKGIDVKNKMHLIYIVLKTTSILLLVVYNQHNVHCSTTLCLVAATEGNTKFAYCAMFDYA